MGLHDGRVGPLPGVSEAAFTTGGGRARCGKASCRCHADPSALHGPYWSWTRKVHNKTATRRLSDEQVRDYQPWFDNARTLRGLVGELEVLSLAVVNADPRWQRR